VLPLRADHAAKPAGERSAKAPTDNLIAWQCYQQAVHRQHTDHPERWSEAVALFEKAIAHDPAFASAYAYLALTRIRLYMLDHPSAFGAMERAREEAQLAVHLNPAVADGHMALGAINATRGHWVEAELNYLAACELDRDWVMTSTMHSAHLLLSVGHLQRALVIGRNSLQDLKGLTSLAALHTAACVLAGADAEARQAAELTIAMGADLTISPMCDVLAMLARREGRSAAAAAALAAALTPYLREAGAEHVIHQVFAAIADPARTEQTRHALDAFVCKLDFSKVPQSMRRQILLWYTEIGALDAAFHLAFRALDFYRSYGIVGTAWGSLWLPEMAPFRRDPRFTEFAKRMRLPEYWTAFGPPDGHLWQDDRLTML
jgi:tetratricopeptide (TPR) repeat protein